WSNLTDPPSVLKHQLKAVLNLPGNLTLERDVGPARFIPIATANIERWWMVKTDMVPNVLCGRDLRDADFSSLLRIESVGDTSIIRPDMVCSLRKKLWSPSLEIGHSLIQQSLLFRSRLGLEARILNQRIQNYFELFHPFVRDQLVADPRVPLPC